jgi:(E)-4-hydroxy-3-methylbut-2-enyl-diphosphate synthase
MTTYNINNSYCESLFSFARRATVEVKVGDTGIGGNSPVRIQTMVATPTQDIEATVAECLKLADAGAELVRITAPALRDAEALGVIRQKLRASSCRVPLIADIHFNPDVAELAARNVEKIRINPGNFTDRQARLADGRLPERDENRAAAKLRERFTGLLKVCREYGTALRIGANHGSLSERIMARYGDTPAGMVESAMEFLRICRDEAFHSVVVSMKASNTRVMVYAYRLLVAAMDAEDMHYPLHLGVTEAGDGEDGRIKSAVGIGTLLADGLGDTIRVSLTEDPVHELPVARQIARYFENRRATAAFAETPPAGFNPYEYGKYESRAASGAGGKNPVAVIEDASNGGAAEEEVEQGIETGIKTGIKTGIEQGIKTVKPRIAPDLSYAGNGDERFAECDYSSLTDSFIKSLAAQRDRIILVASASPNCVAELRACFMKLRNGGIDNPIIFGRRYETSDFERLQTEAACDFGALLIDGFGDGVMISAPDIPRHRTTDLAFGILQAARVRYTRTEYIACPGCGRTLFDLKETLKNVKAATAGFTGLKIGVMGCIVNGPGEMADADYGYVGSGPGKITLYKGKEAVKKNIPQENAIDELITIITQ